jgi:hypothetical protein
MQDTSNKSNNLQDVLGNTLRDLANSSLAAYKPLLEGVLTNFTTLNKSVLSGNLSAIKLPKLFKETCNCCPPDCCDCPPHCIAAINRCAAQGERIIVPCMVKNTCSQAKTYRIGVRELVDTDGKPAPAQPTLNKHSITLQPGRSERVLMHLDLDKFENGHSYSTEIVLRENEINQNICFTLKVNDDCQLVTAEPQDEKKSKLRWQSWQSHYYCEPKKDRKDITVVPAAPVNPANPVITN